MFLCHFTDLSNLLTILENKQLKSNALTKNINKGDGIYKNPNHFIYFCFCRELFNAFNIYEFVFKTVYPSVILYFTPSFLQKKSFYLSSLFSADPTEEGSWTLENGRKYIKKSYPKETINIGRILKQFYINNEFVFLEGQVAIRNTVSLLDNLVAIEFRNCNTSSVILSFIKKQFPTVEIKVTQSSHARDSLLVSKELQFRLNQ